MNRLVTLTYQFYRPILLWNWIFSICGVIFLIKNGFSAIGMSFLIKFTGYGSSLGYQYFMANKSYFYFRNAGYSVRRMYAYVFSVDILIYIVLIVLYSLLPDGLFHSKG
jgi:hypothetical protein